MDMNGWQRTRVLVLGSTGFIGQWVTRRLVRAGADVTVAIRGNSSRERLDPLEIRSTPVVADLSDVGSIESICHDLQPDVTFNLAGYGVDPAQRDEAAALAINGRLVERLGRAVARLGSSSWRGRRLVHVGSALEYGDVSGVITEDTIPNPTTLYGRSKLEGTQVLTQVCRELPLKAVTARLFMVYGPGELAGRLLPHLARLAQTGDDIPLTSGEQRRDFTYVEDVADGLLRLAAQEGSGHLVVNLNTGVLTPVRVVVELAAERLGIAASRLHFGALPTRREEMTGVTAISNQRLRETLSWTPPTSVRDGIRKTFGGAAGERPS